MRDIEEIKDNYEDDFKAYNKLMEEVAKKPIVSKCCLRAGMWDVLDGYRTKFIHHRLACKKLLELKQKSLPRLVYISHTTLQFMIISDLHALWFLRVPDRKPVLRIQGFLSGFVLSTHHPYIYP